MSILVDSRKELAQQQIINLKKRRAAIYQALKELNDCARGIATDRAGLDTLDAEILELISSSKVKEIETRCTQFWLNKSGHGALPIKPEALASSFERPQQLSRLISAAMNAVGLSTEPERYFLHGEVMERPVTTSEEENIYKRCELRAESQEEADLYQFVSNVTRSVMRSAPSTMPVIENLSQMKWIAPLVQVLHKGPGQPNDRLAVNHKMFKLVKFDYLAFDEGLLSEG